MRLERCSCNRIVAHDLIKTIAMLFPPKLIDPQLHVGMLRHAVTADFRKIRPECTASGDELRACGS